MNWVCYINLHKLFLTIFFKHDTLLNAKACNIDNEKREIQTLCIIENIS